ncbi:LysR family transcriptional regulator [Rhodobacteraceae bacterium RKSG542]|uniref:LysR family transcriptional regulator n=1 Tax=Pseudovibrio flavus TaxID=2529854 RepID=UPI0012BC0B75|nr:LysR family transcriptional regulator [Pseudovibrio flavus]MTI17745.1 LysR family transcriptional regulator [Pseudovibrio flavus]
MENSELSARHQPAISSKQIEKLLFFIQVCRSGSISAAAEACDISIATGSRKLCEFEKELGLQLVKRNGPQIQLTRSGEYLFKKSKDVSEIVDRLNQDIESFTKEPTGLIRICCAPVYARGHLIPIITAFSNIYKRINFQIDVNPFGLRDYEKYDILIGAICSYNAYLENNLPLVKKSILTEQFITVASPAYIEKHGKPETPYDLSKHHCLYGSSITKNRKWAYKINGNEVLIRSNNTADINDSHLLHQAACLGLGVAYLPEFIVSESLEQGKLTRLFEDIETLHWHLNLYHQPLGNLDIATELFKNFFLKIARNAKSDDDIASLVQNLGLPSDGSLDWATQNKDEQSFSHPCLLAS